MSLFQSFLWKLCLRFNGYDFTITKMHLSDTLKSQITAENTDVAKVFNFQKKTIQNETYIVAKLV